MNFDFMTSIFLFHDKNTSINDKSIISEKVYFCNVNFTRHPRRQIHQSLSKNRLNLSLIYDAEHSVILTELQSALRLSPHPLTSMLLRISGKFLGIDQALLPNCEWNQKQKHKKQLAVSRRKTPDNNMISWLYQLSKRFLMVGTRYFASATND